MSNIIVGKDGPTRSDPECQWLLDAVDEWRVGSEKPRYDPNWFHCSQLGASDEALIAQYRGVLEYEPRTARELRVFDNGHCRDRDIKRYMLESGLSRVGHDDDRHIRIPYLRLSGEIDDIVAHPETGKWWILENKTINPYGFSGLNQPKPEHVLQVMAYMGATQIDDAVVLYENKGDQAWRGFYVPFSKKIWGDIVDRLLRLRREAEAQDRADDPKIIEMSRALNQELAK